MVARGGEGRGNGEQLFKGQRSKILQDEELYNNINALNTIDLYTSNG